MDIDNIFNLLAWVVPGYCGIRMYWHATGAPRQRGSAETIMASLGWTFVCTVPIMSLFGGSQPLNPTAISGKTIGVWLGSLGLTAIFGWCLGRFRVSEFINAHLRRSAFTSAQDWMNARLLGDNGNVVVGTAEGIYRGKIAYLDNYVEGGSVVLYDPKRQRSDTDTFDQMEVNALFVPGSRILWMAQRKDNENA